MKPVADSKTQLSRIKLRGFKSIAECDLELGALNILIGSNGAGKSNFIEFFEMIKFMQEENLQLYVSRQGGPDALLYFGRKNTEKLEAGLHLGNSGYWCSLVPTIDNRLMFKKESIGGGEEGGYSIGEGGHFETGIWREKLPSLDFSVYESLKQFRVYHFHDTGDNSRLKQRHAINDNVYLRPDARNLAAYLYLLKKTHPSHYQKIVNTTRLVAPFFNDFYLRPQPDNQDMIELEWTEKGEDVPFKAHHLSDGTLRFICMATVLLQPEENQPSTILIDEPELGLHPYAITVLASLLKTVSRSKQIIVSTQSVELVSEFDAEDLLVVDRKDGASVFSRLDPEKLEDWLQEYSLGELWKKNIFGGRPSR